MRILVVLIVLLFLAAVWDVYRSKIPNVIIVMCSCYGMIYMFSSGNVWRYLPGIIFPVLVMFPLYKIGVMGAGDIKLFSVLGFYFPLMESVSCIFVAFLLGAFGSLISLIRYGNFAERITYLFSYLKECFFQGRFRYYYLDSHGNQISGFEEDKSKIHLAIPFFFSVLFHIGGVY